MKIAIATGLAAVTLGLGACAGTMGPDRYQVDLARLESQCRAQNGILQPTGSQSGQASTEYACRTTQATRIPPAR